MSSLRISKTSTPSNSDNIAHSPLYCPICSSPVSLETAKADESGIAIHEECYVLKMELQRAQRSQDPRNEN